MIRGKLNRRSVHARDGGRWRRLASYLLAIALIPVSPTAGSGESPRAAHPDLAGMDDVACADCHSDLLDAPVIHPPAGEGECDTCHEIAGEGDAATVSFTLTGPHLCLACHGDQAEELERPEVHGAIERFGCIVCHDPHAAQVAALLRRPGNALCFECHGGESADRRIDSEGRTWLFESHPAAAPAVNAITKLAPQAGRRGHPVARHPVRAARNPLEPGKPFGCVSCHPAHGALRKPLLVGRSGESLCGRCHRK